MSQPLVKVIRGTIVESQHRGHLVVTNRDGETIFCLGDPDLVTFWRSAAKPFQAIPMVEQGGIKKFGFTGSEIALLTSSHGGEPKHVEAVRVILNKLGLSESSLDCGPSAPMHGPSAKQLIGAGQQFTPLNNACSGKHSGMVALALLIDSPLSEYIQKDHTVQGEMLKAICDCCSLTLEDINLGVDGCGVPVFALPIRNMAMAYARLSQPEGYFLETRVEAMNTICNAMTSHPYFVAGTDRLDTVLMEVTGGKIVAKMGSEGVYCVGIVNEGIGLSLKIEDGNYRAIGPVVIHVLKELDYLSDTEFNQLRHLWQPKLKNHRGDEIGHLEVAFSM